MCGPSDPERWLRGLATDPNHHNGWTAVSSGNHPATKCSVQASAGPLPALSLRNRNPMGYGAQVTR